MNFNLGIRGQLIAGIVITTVAGIGFIGIIALSIFESNIIYYKVKEAASLGRVVRSVANASRLPVTRRSVEELRSSLIDGANLDMLSLSGEDTDLVALGVIPGRFGEGEAGEAGARLLYDEDDIKVWVVGGKKLGRDTRLSVVVGRGFGRALKAEASFSLPLGEVASDVERMRSFIFFFAVADTIIIVLLGIYFLSRYIVRPIKKLEAAATRITGGELDERADVVADNEIGVLAVAFNTMAERLKGEILGLERANRELVSTQEQLIMNSKLAALGRLSAGLAHEIGNPLGAVRGYMDLLTSKDERLRLTEDERADILIRTEKEVSRINDIIREFLDMARPSSEPLKEVDVNLLVRDAVKSIEHHKAFEGVRAELNLQDRLPPVIIDEGKLRQVFYNLLLNAAESMEKGGGVVTIETRTESFAPEATSPGEGAVGRRAGDKALVSAESRAASKEYVTTTFTDQGRGISREDLLRVFDPFFTTKETGEGTGLGLFVSRSLIETYGGLITVESTEGEGTVFTVSLPAEKHERS